MKNVQEVAVILKETVDSVVDAFNRQVKQVVRLVTKQPKKPPLSWESIIGEDGYKKTKKHIGVQEAGLTELPEVNQQLAQLSSEVLNELLRRIQMNIIDEIQAIRLYEKLFDCEVQILRGHVHFYKCSSDKGPETIDYTTLTSRLIGLFIEHRELVALRTAANRA